MKILPVNENSLIIYFADKVSSATADQIANVYRLLKADRSAFIIDIIPSYTSILLSCDLRKTGLRAFRSYLQQLLANLDVQQSTATHIKKMILPVYYGEDVAWDNQAISEHTKLSFSEVIKLHTAETYRVFAMGFAPGFAFLGNTNPLISMPRKANPRKVVPKGSVAIADQQTAIYPDQSPGGWQIIGRTPLELFDLTEANLSKFEMGAQVQFEAIDRNTFLNMGGTLDA